MVDIHNYERNLELALKILKDLPISTSNKEDIIAFKDYCFSEGLSIAKIIRYVYDLRKLAEWLEKDFRTATKKDIEVLAGKIERSDYAMWTKHGLKVALKKFYKWLSGGEEYPVEVKWIKTSTNNNNHKLPEELLTEEDIKKLINATRDTRDRAFISILYESGCRVGEIANLRIKNISFDDYGAVILVNGKTGSRRIRLISCVPYLQEWLDKHPDKTNPNAFVWIKRKSRSEIIGYARISHILKELGERAGIKKRIYPHLFRHSRATYLANHLTEAQMKEFFGWTQSSSMASVYIHLSGRDVDNAILKTYGIKNNNKEEEESKLAPQKCVRCEQVNAVTNKFCKRCGLVLDEATRNKIVENETKRKQADELMEGLVNDKEVLELLLKKIKEKGLKGKMRKIG